MDPNTSNALTRQYLSYMMEREKLLRRTSPQSTATEERKRRCAQRLDDLDHRILPGLQARMSKSYGIEVI